MNSCIIFSQEYTEYLVRHKLYREALAAGRKTMPVSKSKDDTVGTKKAEKPAEPKAQPWASTEIGNTLI
mgnify:FL=1